MNLNNIDIKNYFHYSKSKADFDFWYRNKYNNIKDIIIDEYNIVVINYYDYASIDIFYIKNYKKYLQHLRKEKLLIIL